MHIVTGWSALRVLRALRMRSYRGNSVWLPAVDLPERTAIPTKDSNEVRAPEERAGEADRMGDGRAKTLAECGFEFDSVVAGKRVDFERFYDLGPFTTDDPLELGVFDPNKRVHLKTTKCRLLSRALPQTALLRVDPDLYIAGPELIVAQVGETATLIELIQIIMELCGSYAVMPVPTADSLQMAVYEIPPVTSIAAIKELLGNARVKTRARHLIKQAFAYACEGAASPAETNLSLALGLPMDLGGYGLGMPVLNARLQTPEGERAYVGQDHYDLDLYWADCRADIEYESTEFHLDPLYGVPSAGLRSEEVKAWREDRIARGAHDRIRLRDIQTLGVQVIPVVATDLRDVRSLDHVARSLLHQKALVGCVDEETHLASLNDYDARTKRESLHGALFAGAA